MMRTLTSAVAGTPYSTRVSDEEFRYEERYRDLLYLLFLTSGFDVHCELMRDEGRSDVEVELADRVLIFELKVERETPVSVESALAQIEDVAYGLKHAWKGKRIIEIGVVFRKRRKRERAWLMREYLVETGERVEYTEG